MALHRRVRSTFVHCSWMLAVAAAALLPALADQPVATLPQYLAKQPAFNPQIGPALPGDVDQTLQKQLENEKKFSHVQREFDLNAWQMFLALNWPVDGQGKPKSALTDPGEPRWSTWSQSSLIFRSDGERPSACLRKSNAQDKTISSSDGERLAAERQAPSDDHQNLSISRGLPPFSRLVTKSNDKSALTASPKDVPRRLLGTISSVGELNVARLSEINQAFSGPLIDQHGELVFYDIVLDPNEVRYLCDNRLYTINGQVAFYPSKIDMPRGTSDVDASGAFEVKLAWKILGDKDVAARFYHIPATVADVDTNGDIVKRDVKVGLVGMHIAHKSKSSPQWIWATFEQIDNIDVNQVENPGVSPSFSNPNCESCAVNLPTRITGTGALDRTPTQVWRAIPIPADKVDLNRQAQAALRALTSSNDAKASQVVWQYYQLIDTQWPTSPMAPPTPPSAGAPSAVNNKAGGNPTPIFLTNVTMETFFQHGNQRACKQEEGGCAPGTSVATDPMPKRVFGTESCIGCHSSAGIFKTYDGATGSGQQAGQLWGDFSWLPGQKACWVGGPPGIGQNCAPLSAPSGK